MRLYNSLKILWWSFELILNYKTFVHQPLSKKDENIIGKLKVIKALNEFSTILKNIFGFIKSSFIKFCIFAFDMLPQKMGKILD